MADLEKQLVAALARVPGMDRQALRTTRENALRHGAAAGALIEAIDARLAQLETDEPMALHRLEFARSILRKLDREPALRWVASRDLFNRARLEEADSPFVIWMAGNSARQIPITKALDDVLGEFPNVERRKDGAGQSDRVWYRRLR